MSIYDKSSQERILQQLTLSESFNHFVSRIIKESGFDVSASTNNPSSRTPVGRSWRLFKNKVLIGFVTDYEGQFSTLQWQPCYPDLTNEEVCKF